MKKLIDTIAGRVLTVSGFVTSIVILLIIGFLFTEAVGLFSNPVVGYDGEIRWDTTRPNGTPRKLLDVSKATALGWTHKIELEDGIRFTYDDFLHNTMRAER